MMQYRFVSSLVLVASLAACTSDSSDVEFEEARSSKSRLVSTASTEQVRQFTQSESAFYADMHKKIAAESPNENLIFSPYSIHTVLTMLYAGAKGETASELANGLKLDPTSSSTFEAANKVDSVLAAQNQPNSKLGINNAVFAQKSTNFEMPFLDILAQHYGAGVKLVDINTNPSGVANLIKDWIAQKTENRIKDVLPAVEPGTQMILVNTIYFLGNWATPFEASDTESRAFYSPNGTIGVKMMLGNGRRLYASDENGEMLALPYANNTIDLLLFKPKSNLATFEANWNESTIKAYMDKASERTISYFIPKFEIKGTSLSVKSHLRAMGINNLFTSAADLSGIHKSMKLFVSDIRHQAFIRVDEKGTEAAAATVASVVLVSMTEAQLEFNKPFVFAIRERKTGAILFGGRVTNPIAPK